MYRGKEAHRSELSMVEVRKFFARSVRELAPALPLPIFKIVHHGWMQYISISPDPISNSTLRLHLCALKRMQSTSVDIKLISSTLTLIYHASLWTHWATLGHHSCLSRAAVSASLGFYWLYISNFSLPGPPPESRNFPILCLYVVCNGGPYHTTKPAKFFSGYIFYHLMSSFYPNFFILISFRYSFTVLRLICNLLVFLCAIRLMKTAASNTCWPCNL